MDFVTIMTVDQPTFSGYSYSHEAVNAAMAKIQEDRIKYGSYPLVILDSQSPAPVLDRICGMVTAVRLEGDELQAVIEITENTPSGRIFQVLSKGQPAYYHAVGTACLDENNLRVVAYDFHHVGAYY